MRKDIYITLFSPAPLRNVLGVKNGGFPLLSDRTGVQFIDQETFHFFPPNKTSLACIVRVAPLEVIVLEDDALRTWP